MTMRMDAHSPGLLVLYQRPAERVELFWAVPLPSISADFPGAIAARAAPPRGPIAILRQSIDVGLAATVRKLGSDMHAPGGRP
jgi:hypothetical protein